MSVLEINDLFISFATKKGRVKAVNGVSFALEEGETLCIVGESGSGKSVMAMSILRLLEKNARVDGGSIFFEQDGRKTQLTALSEEEMRRIRGNKISVIFQEPMTALNPVISIGKQLAEPFIIHRKLDKKEAFFEGVKMLEQVKIPAPEKVMKQYPHQLSGGMRQRVMIAMALACKPKILIADEPTTALDVTIQAQILRLMRWLQKEHGTGILFITHDLGVVNEMADKVAVVYCGQVVEYAPKRRIFEKNKYAHPYTEGLMGALPDFRKKGEPLECILGGVPSLLLLPKGCKFAPRCKYCTQKCVREEPDLFEVAKGWYIRCFYPEKEERISEQHAKLVIHSQS